jgi:hypothetical protein
VDGGHSDSGLEDAVTRQLATALLHYFQTLGVSPGGLQELEANMLQAVRELEALERRVRELEDPNPFNL